MSDYTDIYGIINGVARQVTGREDIVAIDTQSFIAVGTMILDQSTDNIYRALTNSWERTYWASRPYVSSVMKSVEVDEERWGYIARKVSFEPLDMEKSQNWNTDLESDQLDDGKTINPFSIRKAKPVEFKFAGSKTLQSHITHFRDELESALQSEEEFGSWYYAKMVEYFNDIETKDEVERRLVVLNFMMGAILTNAPGSIVDLTNEYNTAFGTSYTREQLLTTYGESFRKFASARMQMDSKRLKDRTARYHANVIGHTLLRHTPKEFQKMLILTSFITDAKAQVYSGLFNPEYLDIGTYEEVNFWQDPNSEAEVNIKPLYLNVADGSIARAGGNVNPKYVVGCLYDERALTVTNKRRSSGSIYNPASDSTNDFIHWLKRYNNDFTENHVVYWMSAGGDSKETRESIINTKDATVEAAEFEPEKAAKKK